MRVLSSTFPIISLLFGIAIPMVSLGAVPKETLILVDKKSHTLKLATYDEKGYKILNNYHAVIGKVGGDKLDQGDLKTPEGIYDFQMRLTPPTLKPKFGVMAYYMNYPNAYDKIAGNTGDDIMLHATDTPERLEKNFDSEGCIVVNNQQLKEIEPYIQVGLTPILVFSDLKEEYMHPSSHQALRDFFDNWIHAWENKKIDQYISNYHTAFRADGKDKLEWRNHKDRLNSIYKRIEVNPTEVRIFPHPKYTMIRFIQNYKSIMQNGKVGHASTGTKTILVGKEFGKYKIFSEDYSNLRW